jgi:hypothetical protein
MGYRGAQLGQQPAHCFRVLMGEVAIQQRDRGADGFFFGVLLVGHFSSMG